MAGKHTSVIYFHGVGDPRRHVSLSSFLDYFDLYGQTQDKGGIGRPRTFSYKSELIGDQILDFVEFKRVVDTGEGPRVKHTVRVYEAYWVPQALTRFGPLYLIFWFIGRLLAPVKVILTSWRSFPSLKLLALHQLAEGHPRFGHIEKLERHYRDFENWENRTAFPKGRFREFLKMIAEKARPQEVRNLQAIAHEWRGALRLLVLRQFTLVAAVSVAAVWLLALAAFSGWRVAQQAVSSSAPMSVGFTAPAVVFVVVLVLLLLMGAKLRSYLFDVLAWTMESEKDERFAARQKVVQLGQALIRHTTSDPECVSTIIVGHSLGTCIAAEALLEEGQKASLGGTPKGLRDIAKVRTVFTVASPIDRIFFFFQADATFSHRYHRLLEEQRISLGLPPFRFRGFTGRARLYNFWSRFDPISSPVFSLRKAISERRDALFNIEVLPRDFPLPLSAHTSYFADPRLMRMIYHAVMENAVPSIDAPEPIGPIVGQGAFLITPMLAAVLLGSGTILLSGANPILVASGLAGAGFLVTAWAVAKRRRYQARVGNFLGRSS